MPTANKSEAEKRSAKRLSVFGEHAKAWAVDARIYIPERLDFGQTKKCLTLAELPFLRKASASRVMDLTLLGIFSPDATHLVSRSITRKV